MVREATRRGVLAAVVSLPLVATGCKGIGALGTPPRQQPDVTVVRDAIDGETLMISRYNAVLAAVPALAGSSARCSSSTTSTWPGCGHG